MQDVIFYQKKINCKYCGNNFLTYRVRTTRVKYVSIDSDFCPHYDEVNPLFYDVNVCPHCGLSFTDNFLFKKDPKKHNELIASYINQLENVRDICQVRTMDDALYAYKLAIVVAGILDESSLIVANLGLRIAWFYRYLQDEKNENKFLEKVLNIYLKLYQYEDLETLNMDKYKLIYLIGELHGRLGDYHETAKWFSLIIEEQKAQPKIRKLAKERWYEYRQIK